MDMMKRAMLRTLPLEFITYMLTFLSWTHDLHPLLLVRKFLDPTTERF